MINYIIASVFVAISIAYYFKVPSQYKNIPKISLLGILESFRKGRLLDDHFNQIIAPHLRKRGYALNWSLGGWGILIAKPEIIKQIFRNNSQFIKSSTNNPHTLFAKFVGQKNILSSEGDEWRRFRRPAIPIFHHSFQPEFFAECVTETLDAFSNRINKNSGQPVVVGDLIELMTLDVLGKGILSHDFKAIKSMGSSRYHILYSTITKGFSNVIYFLFPVLERFPIGERAKTHASVKEFNEFILGIINQRRKDMKSNKFVNSKDLLSTMLREDPDSSYEPFTDEELLYSLNVFFLGGHDTTAITLTFAMYYLARNPHVQDKLRKEIFDTLGISKEHDVTAVPTIEQLKQMNYMRLFIKEVMRIYPVVNLIPRKVDEDYTIPGDNIVIRKGTTVDVDVYGIHHDPSIYPDPEKFDPERFLNGKYDSDIYMPFGGGSRICIGINFTLMEQKVYLTMLLQKFILDIQQNNSDYQNLRVNSFGLIQPKDLQINLVPRF